VTWFEGTGRASRASRDSEPRIVELEDEGLGLEPFDGEGEDVGEMGEGTTTTSAIARMVAARFLATLGMTNGCQADGVNRGRF
jgi:hypothetical protein